MFSRRRRRCRRRRGEAGCGPPPVARHAHISLGDFSSGVPRLARCFLRRLAASLPPRLARCFLRRLAARLRRRLGAAAAKILQFDATHEASWLDVGRGRVGSE